MKILVYGWYHQGNLGDELFEEAFSELFPDYRFEFTDHITAKKLQGMDGVFIGGGSFLNEEPKILHEALPLVMRKKVFYLGVGAETNIHPIHRQMIAAAELIAIRTPEHIEKIREINPDVIAVPDLVTLLRVNVSPRKINKSVLIIPNVTVVPSWKDPQWMHSAWNYFKSEFSQFLDGLVNEKYQDISFLPFCVNPQLDDRAISQEIINATSNRYFFHIHFKPNSLRDATELMSEYDVVITQRYHGMVLANMVGLKNFSIYHHDKLRHPQGYDLSYYGITKDALKKQLEKQYSEKVSPLLPIDRNIIRDLTQKVDDALCRGQK